MRRFYSVMVSEHGWNHWDTFGGLKKTWEANDLSYNARVPRAPSLQSNYSMKPGAKCFMIYLEKWMN